MTSSRSKPSRPKTSSSNGGARAQATRTRAKKGSTNRTHNRPPFAATWKVEPYYATGAGIALHGDALRELRGIKSKSINLIVTSPPYALQKQKEYRNVSQDEYVAWFRKFVPEFKRVLTDDGSLVINVGGAWEQGRPVRSLYHYELLLSLVKDEGLVFAQDFFWLNTAKMPYPYEWVSQQRTRVKDAVEPVWWLSKSANPKADNRRVLQPYSASMKYMLKRGYYNHGKRPSGSVVHETSWLRDNGGSIPPNFSPPPSELEAVTNLLAVANTESSSAYQQACREHAKMGYRVHPARFPRSLPEFFISFLTEEGDTVLDPFAGSNLTGQVAQELGRKWVAIELDEMYIRSSAWRFSKFLAAPPPLADIKKAGQAPTDSRSSATIAPKAGRRAKPPAQR